MPPEFLPLLQLDPKSERFLELFRSFLTFDKCGTILTLEEEDARLAIEIIDTVRSFRTFLAVIQSFDPITGTKALRVAKPETELRKFAFSVLRRLCGKMGHLPESYLLSDKFDLSVMPHASSGFADVRVGMFKGKEVAVKTLRVFDMDDKMRIHKVGHPSYGSSRFAHIKLCSGSAKRLPRGRVCPIPIFSISLESLTLLRMENSP